MDHDEVQLSRGKLRAAPTGSAEHAALAAALLEPAVYGEGIERVDRLETHISYVYLAGDYAYKVKKAVNLGFLDFSSLAARRFYCEQELRLNRRLAPALYLAVVPITGTPDHPVLGGEGTAIEYAVKMRRFSQDDLLARVLARGRLLTTHIDQLAEKIAEFHAAAAVASADDPFGSAETVCKPALENFTQIRSAAPKSFDLAELEALERWTLSQSRALEAALAARKRGGFVRECHGDFHLGNLALVGGEITIFDCLEFSDELRWIDVMSEVGFLVMDLRDRRQPRLAQRFLNRYLEISGDYEGLKLLRFYVVYRALVRAKVHLLRARQAGFMSREGARLLAQFHGYIALASAQLDDPRATLLITHGPSGSGKTTCTQPLLETLGAVRIRSDLERKRLHGVAELARSGSDVARGLYAADATARTYARLRDLAAAIVDAGYTVIVDATFLKRSPRLEFRALAEERGLPFRILDFTLDEPTLRRRIAQRERGGGDASEAGVEVLAHQLKNREPLRTDERIAVVPFDARNSCDAAARELAPRLRELTSESV